MLAVDIAACVVQRLRIQLERFAALDLTGLVMHIPGQIQLQLPLTVEQTALGVIESRSGNSQPLTSQPLATRIVNVTGAAAFGLTLNGQLLLSRDFTGQVVDIPRNA